MEANPFFIRFHGAQTVPARIRILLFFDFVPAGCVLFLIAIQRMAFEIDVCGGDARSLYPWLRFNGPDSECGTIIRG